MLSRIKSAATVLKEWGAGRTARYAMHRLVEKHYERRFGIKTEGEILHQALGISNPDSVEYSPTSYPGFFRAMRHVPVSGAFVDYGCGLGRIVVCAASLSFTRVIGVEISQELVNRAQQNVDQAKRIKCRTEFACMDASLWNVPKDVTVFHFYNPFMRQTLRTVVMNIFKSLQESPREVWIVFAFPWGMDALMKSGEVIPLAWQKSSVDEAWPLHTVKKEDPNGNGYRVYRLDSRPLSSHPSTVA